MRLVSICLTLACLLPSVGLGGCAGAENPPQLMGTAEPGYPAAAREANVEGYVVVEYDVTTEGRVINPQVIESEPKGVFDAAALAAVSGWRFHPAKDESLERTVHQVSRLTFSLGGGDDYSGYD